MMRWLLFAAASICIVPGSGSAATTPLPAGFADICIGASIEELAPVLDLRDIASALAAMKGAGKPDLGARGYGCSRRDDAYAEITCVSHDERPFGLDLREIRLQFRRGLLRQLSITAELRQSGALRGAIESRLGPSGPSTEAAAEWRPPGAIVRLHEGPNLVFVVFERPPGAGESAVECRLPR